MAFDAIHRVSGAWARLAGQTAPVDIATTAGQTRAVLTSAPMATVTALAGSWTAPKVALAAGTYIDASAAIPNASVAAWSAAFRFRGNGAGSAYPVASGFNSYLRSMRLSSYILRAQMDDGAAALASSWQETIGDDPVWSSVFMAAIDDEDGTNGRFKLMVDGVVVHDATFPKVTLSRIPRFINATTAAGGSSIGVDFDGWLGIWDAYLDPETHWSTCFDVSNMPKDINGTLGGEAPSVFIKGNAATWLAATGLTGTGITDL